MAKVKQPYPEAREVPWLGHRTVERGEVVDVPADDLPGYLEAGWTPADDATRKAAAQLVADGTVTVADDATRKAADKLTAQRAAAEETES